MTNKQSLQTTASPSGKGADLIVENLEVTVSYLGVSISMLILVIVADYLVISNWGIFTGTSDTLQDFFNYRRIGGIVFVPVVLLAFGNLYMVRTLFNRGISEILLGIVSLDFSGRGKVQAAVTIKPLAKVFVETISLKMTVVKKYSVKYGKSKRTRRITVFEETDSQKIEKDVESGRPLKTTFAITFDEELPATDVYVDEYYNLVEVIWEAEIRIVLRRWPDWYKNTILKISPS